MSREDPQNSEVFKTFTSEKIRGMFVSLVTASVANGLNVFGQTTLGLNPLLSTSLFLQVGGSLLVYTGDILFAKSEFDGVALGYNSKDLLKRWKWLKKSLVSPVFLKFVITVIIDTIIILEVLRFTLDVLDENGFKFRYRNEICAAIIGIVVFILWSNALRFNWAYGPENGIMNVVVMAWMGIVVMVYATSRNMIMHHKASLPATQAILAPVEVPNEVPKSPQ